MQSSTLWPVFWFTPVLGGGIFVDFVLQFQYTVITDTSFNNMYKVHVHSDLIVDVFSLAKKVELVAELKQAESRKV